MKLPAMVALLWIGCSAAEPDLQPKPWHVSPDSNPQSSVSYPYAAWNVVTQLHAGMSEAEVEALVGQKMQYYLHPTNAIVFSRTPRGRNVEVALKRAPDGTVEELSFKPWE